MKITNKKTVRVGIGKTLGKMIVLSMAMGELRGRSPKRVLDTAVNVSGISADERAELSSLRATMNAQQSPRSYVFTGAGDIKNIPYNNGVDVTSFVTSGKGAPSVNIFYSGGCPENLY